MDFNRTRIRRHAWRRTDTDVGTFVPVRFGSTSDLEVWHQPHGERRPGGPGQRVAHRLLVAVPPLQAAALAAQVHGCAVEWPGGNREPSTIVSRRGQGQRDLAVGTLSIRIGSRRPPQIASERASQTAISRRLRMIASGVV